MLNFIVHMMHFNCPKLERFAPLRTYLRQCQTMDAFCPKSNTRAMDSLQLSSVISSRVQKVKANQAVGT